MYSSSFLILFKAENLFQHIIRLSFKICVNFTEWHKTKLVQGVKPQLGLTP